jgi:GTP cyclohydrolase II
VANPTSRPLFQNSAPLRRTRLDISSPLSFSLLHSLRAVHDAVLVGINTVLADDPQLNVRVPLPGVMHTFPRPVVVDTDLKILDYPCSRLRIHSPIVCTCLDTGSDRWQQAARELQPLNGTLVSCKRDAEGRCDLKDCFATLKRDLGVASILVEGGAGIIQSVLEANLVDQLVVTIRPSFLGGYRSLTRELPHPVHLVDTHVASVGGDIVLYSRVQQRVEPPDDKACVLPPPASQNRAPVVLIANPAASL